MRSGVRVYPPWSSEGSWTACTGERWAAGELTIFTAEALARRGEREGREERRRRGVERASSRTVLNGTQAENGQESSEWGLHI